jgi:hypothetical protein
MDYKRILGGKEVYGQGIPGQRDPWRHSSSSRRALARGVNRRIARCAGAGSIRSMGRLEGRENRPEGIFYVYSCDGKSDRRSSSPVTPSISGTFLEPPVGFEPTTC